YLDKLDSNHIEPPCNFSEDVLALEIGQATMANGRCTRCDGRVKRVDINRDVYTFSVGDMGERGSCTLCAEFAHWHDVRAVCYRGFVILQTHRRHVARRKRGDALHMR